MAAQYQTMKAAPAAVDALRQLAFALSVRTGRRVTLSEALTAAVAVASADPDATATALPEGVDQ